MVITQVTHQLSMSYASWEGVGKKMEYVGRGERKKYVPQDLKWNSPNNGKPLHQLTCDMGMHTEWANILFDFPQPNYWKPHFNLLHLRSINNHLILFMLTCLNINSSFLSQGVQIVDNFNARQKCITWWVHGFRGWSVIQPYTHKLDHEFWVKS